jgi:hypothetical protein
VKGIDCGAVSGREGRVLLCAMRVKAINPENRIIDTIADAIGPVVLRELHGPPQTERAQGRIVKGGGTGNVRDTDPSMVEHDS